MLTNDGWLDQTQVTLSNACKSQSWNLKQTSSHAPGTRSYIVSYKSKDVTVLISSLISTLVEADVKFEHDDIEYDEDQMRRILAPKLK
jgi:hypothetical protein